ncbi:recombinase family protein [Cupriavidus sp. 2MCAB6]|uniref:recombinase family protein n=1 Tax=Cupriavidus sp. 2MCAB6 TaxID=3232981 RepID=UPI003F8E079C
MRRRGFERLLGQLRDGTVGAVFAIEASRLARNGRDWHTLLEFCSLVNALLIDADSRRNLAGICECYFDRVVERIGTAFPDSIPDIDRPQRN